MGLIKFFGLEKETVEKVYCEECKNVVEEDCHVICDKNPKKILDNGNWYYRPFPEDYYEPCSVKNKNNNCPDFDKK